MTNELEMLRFSMGLIAERTLEMAIAPPFLIGSLALLLSALTGWRMVVSRRAKCLAGISGKGPDIGPAEAQTLVELQHWLQEWEERGQDLEAENQRLQATCAILRKQLGGGDQPRIRLIVYEHALRSLVDQNPDLAFRIGQALEEAEDACSNVPAAAGVLTASDTQGSDPLRARPAALGLPGLPPGVESRGATAPIHPQG